MVPTFQSGVTTKGTAKLHGNPDGERPGFPAWTILGASWASLSMSMPPTRIAWPGGPRITLLWDATLASRSILGTPHSQDKTHPLLCGSAHLPRRCLRVNRNQSPEWREMEHQSTSAIGSWLGSALFVAVDPSQHNFGP